MCTACHNAFFYLSMKGCEGRNREETTKSTISRRWEFSKIIKERQSVHWQEPDNNHKRRKTQTEIVESNP